MKLDIGVNGNDVGAKEELENEMDNTVFEIYGLTTEEIAYVNDYLSQKGVE